MYVNKIYREKTRGKRRRLKEIKVWQVCSNLPYWLAAISLLGRGQIDDTYPLMLISSSIRFQLFQLFPLAVVYNLYSQTF